MRIYTITSGAADMYCGSCLRDNALATELKAQGHQVMLLPTYTPTLTDEPNVSEPHVYFGGVSVYLEQHGFARRSRMLDWLWDSPALLRLLSRFSIRTDPRALGELTVSMLRGEAGYQGKEFAKLVDDLRSMPRPDVVALPHSLLIAAAGPVRRALGVPVCCTLQGEDLFLEGLNEPYRRDSLELIRRGVPDVDAFIATSEYYARFMADYLSIPLGKIHTVPLGINLTGYDRVSRDAERPFTIGYFARVTPEKSLHLLAEAYRVLRREHRMPPARLEAAGYLAAEFKGYLREIEDKVRGWGLADEFAYRGVLSREEKIRFLQGLDVISVPSEYAEPKGMYLLEAMACGVPFVQPRHGAFPEIAARTNGGVLFEPGNVASLADALAALWRDSGCRAELARNGYEGVWRHFAVERMARDTVAVYESIAAKRAAAAPAAVAPA